MRLERLSTDSAGAHLARSVVDPEGKVLLAAGSRLTARYVERLLARGVLSVYLADDLVNDVVPDETVQRDTRAEGLRLVRGALARIDRPGRPGLATAACQALLSEILDGVWRNHGLSVDLGEIRRVSPYTFAHSVRSMVVAVLLGAVHGLDRTQLRMLGTGTLLQDIGIVRYVELIAQPRPLTLDELVLLQRHAEDGYHYLREEAGVGLLVAHVAYQHHERLDGSGYPRGLGGDEMHTFARVAAVADVYDALTADRPFKPGMPAHEAMSVLRGMAEDKLDPEFVRHLSEQVAVYAAGTTVLLGGGELAVVLDPAGSGPGRPVVRILTDGSRRLAAPRDVDLGLDPAGRAVRQVLPDLPAALRRYAGARQRGGREEEAAAAGRSPQGP